MSDAGGTRTPGPGLLLGALGLRVGEPGSGLWDTSLSTQPLPPHQPDQVFCYQLSDARGRGTDTSLRSPRRAAPSTFPLQPVREAGLLSDGYRVRAPLPALPPTR